MIFIEQKIPGVFLIDPEPFKDDRSVFRSHFCKMVSNKDMLHEDYL
jgi:dTDP-4-dehydrorhamnose 3,5-epimerase-like enzyme